MFSKDSRLGNKKRKKWAVYHFFQTRDQGDLLPGTQIATLRMVSHKSSYPIVFLVTYFKNVRTVWIPLSAMVYLALGLLLAFVAVFSLSI